MNSSSLLDFFLLSFLILFMSCTSSLSREEIGVDVNEKPLIYVKNLISTKGVSPEETNIISSEIEKAVISCGRYEVMSQSQVNELFKAAEQKQLLGCNAEECLRKIMKSTMTDYLLYGSISKDEGEYAISVNLIRQKEGETFVVEKTATKFSRSLSSKYLTSIAQEIIKDLRGDKNDISMITSDDDSDVLIEVNVKSTPPGAKLYINEVLKGETPLIIRMPAFKYQGKLAYTGYILNKFDISIPQKIDYYISLEKVSNQLLKTKKIGDMDFIYIPGGLFVMGSKIKTGKWVIDDVVPEHEVTLDSFWMGKYEVTQKQYEDIMGTNPSHFQGDPKLPVERVSWNNAMAFCKKFSAKHGIEVRLPYEAEWEYACRAGSTTEYYWGDTIDGDYLWWDDNSGYRTHPVGNKLPNAWGLYDIIGNVAEWCMDWYDKDYYKVSPNINPKGPTAGKSRVVRDVLRYNDVGKSCFRSWGRYFDHPNYASYWYGFRLVVSPGE